MFCTRVVVLVGVSGCDIFSFVIRSWLLQYPARLQRALLYSCTGSYGILMAHRRVYWASNVSSSSVLCAISYQAFQTDDSIPQLLPPTYHITICTSIMNRSMSDVRKLFSVLYVSLLMMYRTTLHSVHVQRHHRLAQCPV